MSGSCCTEFGNTLNLGHVGELNVRAREVTVVSAPPPPSRPTSKKKKKKRRCSLFQALWGRKRNKSGKCAKGKRKEPAGGAASAAVQFILDSDLSVSVPHAASPPAHFVLDSNRLPSTAISTGRAKE